MLATGLAAFAAALDTWRTPVDRGSLLFLDLVVEREY